MAVCADEVCHLVEHHWIAYVMENEHDGDPDPKLASVAVPTPPVPSVIRLIKVLPGLTTAYSGPDEIPEQ